MQVQWEGQIESVIGLQCYREGKWIMMEMRFTKFLALSVGPRVGISWSASETDV